MPPAVRIRCSPAMISVEGADLESRRHAVLDVGVASLADRADPPVAHADVGLHDAPVVDDDRVGDDEVRRAVGARGLRLSLTVANDLAAAEDDLFAVSGESRSICSYEVRVAQSDAIARGRTVEIGVRAT